MAPPAMQMVPTQSREAPPTPLDAPRYLGRTIQSKVPNAADAILVQGGSLRTWSYRSPAVEQ
eukprot:scaffold181622_cov13-Tisochrysis_lutea.AAC.1